MHHDISGRGYHGKTGRAKNRVWTVVRAVGGPEITACPVQTNT